MSYIPMICIFFCHVMVHKSNLSGTKSVLLIYNSPISYCHCNMSYTCSYQNRHAMIWNNECFIEESAIFFSYPLMAQEIQLFSNDINILSMILVPVYIHLSMPPCQQRIIYFLTSLRCLVIITSKTMMDIQIFRYTQITVSSLQTLATWHDIIHCQIAGLNQQLLIRSNCQINPILLHVIIFFRSVQQSDLYVQEHFTTSNPYNFISSLCQ